MILQSKMNCLIFLTVAFIATCLFYTVSGDYNCEYKKDGFYSDEDFCHIYWRCNYGIAEEYECPAGTAWNHVEMRCDWLDNVDCSRIENKKTDKSDDDEDKETAETTRKSKKSKKTTAAEDIETTTMNEDVAETESIETETKPAILRSTTQRIKIVTNPSRGPTPTTYDYDVLCENINVTTGFREDPFICNKYIRCNHGYAQKFKCSKNTAWDIKKKSCIWAEFVECGKRVLLSSEQLLGPNDSDDKMKHNGTRSTRSITTTTERKKSPDTLNELAELTSTEKQNANGQTSGASLVCTSLGTFNVTDSSNCASYFACNNGKETKLMCPDKQLFNMDTTQCEDFQSVFCGSRPVNMADKNQCSSKRDGIYPDLDRSCKVFYQCVSQQKVREATCPNSLKFNSVTGRCDNPINIIAPCGSYSVSKASFSTISMPSLLVGISFIYATKIALAKYFTH